MQSDMSTIKSILQRAACEGRSALLETEGLEILECLGIPAPRYIFVKSHHEASSADLSFIEGAMAVIKVVSPQILHKSDVGGVRIVTNDRDAIVATVDLMERKFEHYSVTGFTISQFVPYDSALGSELLVGARWTGDFGPVVTFGPGGIYTEFLAQNFRVGKGLAILSAAMDEDQIQPLLEETAVCQLITGSLRGQKPRIRVGQVVDVVRRFIRLAREFMPGAISECEINPLVIRDGSLVALDVLVKLGSAALTVPQDRPIQKIDRLLQPRSVGIIGVSEKLNPGHIILNNLLREGFDGSKILVVKPNTEKIEGCRCVPDIASLPERVDLFILSIDAAQAPGALTEIIEKQKAESVILIPGGLEEKKGTEEIVQHMRDALYKSRATSWGGPVVNGGNCLGVTSRPGHYDTMFIPESKLPVPKKPVMPIAIISQSGAFAVAKASKLSGINPKYSITVGNQMDLTVGDYLSYLKNDEEIVVFAVYVEGFRPLDGLRFLNAAAEITASGRTVIFYRAGRTAEGAQAAASHTASIAGDYTVTQQLAKNSGVLLADTLADFEDLVKLFAFLREKDAAGTRLGAVSNAGFECVAVADNLGQLQLASFEGSTVERLSHIFEAARIDKVVDIHNPIDLTPMTSDGPFAATVEAVLEDRNVDVGVVGCVPLTVALNTLPPGEHHRDDVFREDSIAGRMARLKEKLSKPWVAVVDSGALYDPLVVLLEDQEVPTFRCMDRALQFLNVFCESRIRRNRLREKEVSLVS